MFLFISLPLHAQTALKISPRQALVYREILSNYQADSQSAYFSSGGEASSPIYFSGFIGKEPRLELRLLNPQYSSKNPIRRCEAVLSGGGESSSYSFVWNSPNGLMTASHFAAGYDALVAFLLANSHKESLSLIFYGDKGQDSIPLSEGESRKFFLALKLAKEITFQGIL